MGVFADRLVNRLTNQDVWPDADSSRVWAQVKAWIAFRESDRDVLRADARWRNQVRDYLLDPLAPKISEAFASTIFGRAPKNIAANTGDQGNLDNIVKANNFASQLQRQEKRCSSEAEVWYRQTSNPQVDQAPMVCWHSRLDVIPIFHKDTLRAVAFHTELDPLAETGESQVWRHFEIIDATSIVNVLFLGTHDTIGLRCPLTDHPETENLMDEVEHELPYMPAGRIPNREGVDSFYAISDYSGIEDFLFGLNEILTIAMENIRLTLKKRVTIPASAVDEAGTIDASQEVIVVEDLHENLGKGGAGQSDQFNVLQYQSDIDEVIKAQNAFAEAALTRVGIVPAYVGMTTDQSEGRAMSGTALRLRLIPTVNAAEDRAQYWDDALPKILCNLQILDSRPMQDPGENVLGGFGRLWQQPGAPPSIERGPSLPEDPVEETTVHATRVSASIESRETAVRSLHPEWSDLQVKAEMARLDEDLTALKSLGAVGALFDTGAKPPTIRGDN